MELELTTQKACLLNLPSKCRVVNTFKQGAGEKVRVANPQHEGGLPKVLRLLRNQKHMEDATLSVFSDFL